MIVRVPYVEGMLHHRVLPAIERQGHAPDLALIEDRDHGYRSLIEEWCRLAVYSRRDLCIIEQDVESRSGTLDSYVGCPEPWCFHAYRFWSPYEECGAVGTWTPLGHTRFTWQACELLLPLFGEDHWRNLPSYGDMDRMMSAHLYYVERIVPHRHPGDVIHHHDYSAQLGG